RHRFPALSESFPTGNADSQRGCMSSIARSPIVVAFKTLVIVAAGVALGSAQGSHEVPTEFNEFTVAQLQEAMSHGRLTSEALTRYYLDRIFALDQNGPGVNSVIELNP